MSKYKIIIGDGLFESECFRDDLGFVYKFPHNGGNIIREETLKLMGAKIEEVKEPLRVEFETTVAVSYSTGQYDDYVTKKGLLTFGDITWVGKKVKVTVTEILPTQCEHNWKWFMSSAKSTQHTNKVQCTKCGELK